MAYTTPPSVPRRRSRDFDELGVVGIGSGGGGASSAGAGPGAGSGGRGSATPPNGLAGEPSRFTAQRMR